MRVDHVFEAFQPTNLRQSTTVLPRNFDCLKTLMDTYEDACEKMDDYSLTYVKLFVQECESLSSNDELPQVVDRLVAACNH
jgi:hypothetical protein